MSIELRQVSKRFGEVAAVQGVSFAVADGELVALLGPSGGGKTTVLRMIAGLETPTSGDVLIRRVRVNHVPVQRRNIGFVFQNYALFKNMTVFENIAFGLRIKKWGQLEAGLRVKELLEQFDLTGLEHRYPHQLSGGQRQRVAIARALVNDPSVILADEPTGNLDSATGAEIMAIFDELQAKGNSILLVTHEEEVARHAYRVIRLRDGLVESDTASRVAA